MSDNDDLWMFFIVAVSLLTGAMLGSMADEPQNPSCAPTQVTTQ